MDNMDNISRPSPDFSGFARALREEAEWMATIHPRDDDRRSGTGSVAGEQRELLSLARQVEFLGRHLGLWDDAQDHVVDAEQVGLRRE